MKKQHPFLISLSIYLLLVISSMGQVVPEEHYKAGHEDKLQETSEELIFSARQMVSPSGVFEILSSSNYTVSFSTGKIISNLPFKGIVHMPVVGGEDHGLSFSGVPEEFKKVKQDSGYEINARVRDNGETFKMNLTVRSSGTATLTLSGSNRETMIFLGSVNKSK